MRRFSCSFITAGLGLACVVLAAPAAAAEGHPARDGTQIAAATQVAEGTLSLGMDFAGTGRPVISFTPTVTVTGAETPMPGNDGVVRSVDASGLANVSGMTQSVQVAGDRNVAANVTRLNVRDGSVPGASGAGSSVLAMRRRAQALKAVVPRSCCRCRGRALSSNGSAMAASASRSSSPATTSTSTTGWKSIWSATRWPPTHSWRRTSPRPST